MDTEECREDARECYRLAQTMPSIDARLALLGLMVQWRRLAEQTTELEQRELSLTPANEADGAVC